MSSYSTPGVIENQKRDTNQSYLSTKLLATNRRDSVKIDSSTRIDSEDIPILKLNPMLLLQGIIIDKPFYISENDILEFALPLTIVDIDKKTIFQVHSFIIYCF